MQSALRRIQKGGIFHQISSMENNHEKLSRSPRINPGTLDQYLQKNAINRTKLMHETLYSEFSVGKSISLFKVIRPILILA